VRAEGAAERSVNAVKLSLAAAERRARIAQRACALGSRHIKPCSHVVATE